MQQAQPESNGEPDFNASELNNIVPLRNLQSHIELGTYVSYLEEGKESYGRIVKYENMIITINKYFTVSQVKEDIVDDTTIPSAIQNRFIGVREIYRTYYICEIPVEQLHGIIFIFHTNEFMINTYEGSKHVFCLRYEYNNNLKTFTPILSSSFLAHPCQYPHFEPPYKSYSLRILQNLQRVKEWVTCSMSRSSQNYTGSFVKASVTYISTNEFWTYLKFVCKSSMKVHGPFQARRKIYKMRSHIDFSASREESFFEALRFESVDAFAKFDELFGKYSRYGCVSVQKPSVGETISMERDHRISFMGNGLPICATDFKRRNVFDLGIDLKFNIHRDTLSIALRYTTKKVRKDERLLAILREREEFTRSRTRNQVPTSRNLRLEYMSVIRKDVEFFLENAAYSVNDDYTDTMLTRGVPCTVIESEGDPPVKLRHIFTVDEVKRYILDFLDTLSTNR